MGACTALLRRSWHTNVGHDQSLGDHTPLRIDTLSGVRGSEWWAGGGGWGSVWCVNFIDLLQFYKAVEFTDHALVGKPGDGFKGWRTVYKMRNLFHDLLIFSQKLFENSALNGAPKRVRQKNAVRNNGFLPLVTASPAGGLSLQLPPPPGEASTVGTTTITTDWGKVVVIGECKGGNFPRGQFGEYTK